MAMDCKIHQGEVTAVNVNYTGRGNRSARPSHLGLAGAKAKATLIGNITQGELVVSRHPDRRSALRRRNPC